MKTIALTLISFMIVLTGCVSMKPGVATDTYSNSGRSGLNLSDTDTIKSILYSQFNDWKAVRYKTGGLSKRGIDCSGFVYVTYLDRFGIKLPRGTELQSRSGLMIAKGKLKAGDLIFFKTGLKTRHVGIYLEDGKFIHASTSRGVMMSDLDNGYWSKRYWKSVRIKTDRCAHKDTYYACAP